MFHKLPVRFTLLTLAGLAAILGIGSTVLTSIAPRWSYAHPDLMLAALFGLLFVMFGFVSALQLDARRARQSVRSPGARRNIFRRRAAISRSRDY